MIKIETIHDDQNRTMMVARWWRDGMRPTGLQWMQDTSYIQIDHGMCSEFSERWYAVTSSFHLQCGQMTVTLDDVSCLLHLPIDGMLLSHESMTRTEVVHMMVEHVGDTWKKVTNTKGGHAQFNYFKIIFKERLLGQQKAYNEDDRVLMQ